MGKLVQVTYIALHDGKIGPGDIHCTAWWENWSRWHILHWMIGKLVQVTYIALHDGKIGPGDIHCTAWWENWSRWHITLRDGKIGTGDIHCTAWWENWYRWHTLHSMMGKIGPGDILHFMMRKLVQVIYIALHAGKVDLDDIHNIAWWKKLVQVTYIALHEGKIGPVTYIAQHDGKIGLGDIHCTAWWENWSRWHTLHCMMGKLV